MAVRDMKAHESGWDRDRLWRRTWSLPGAGGRIIALARRSSAEPGVYYGRFPLTARPRMDRTFPTRNIPPSIIKLIVPGSGTGASPYVMMPEMA
jgi:hypothetical protein